jgi:hypothetical protein
VVKGPCGAIRPLSWATSAANVEPQSAALSGPLLKDMRAVAKDVGPPAKDDGDSRIAPDPFAAVLPAIAALGTIASIAAINWTARERAADRVRPKRKAVTALRELETCCLHLSEIFRRFQRNPRLFAGEGAQGASPLKFGVHGPRVSPDAAKLYQQAINDVASMLVLASQSAFEVMCAVEDGTVEAPEAIFYGFGECQDQLNKLIQNRATLKASVDTGVEVAERLAQLVRELKKYRTD